jgi:lipopolysaccharide/colanic/teichoic acid biosynthesis glycosyltransferase
MSTVWNALERVAAVILIVILLPLFLVIAAAIWSRASRTPILAHRRSGRFGKPFWMLKFRTMWGASAPQPAGCGLIDYAVADPENIKPASDPRVTGAFARFLRRYSIDELPQLIHVVSGRMALVGPRPLTAEEWRKHYGSDAEEVLRLRPGMTGLWQVMGRSRLSYRQRRRLDLFLVRHSSVRFKLWILARTARLVIGGQDAW